MPFFTGIILECLLLYLVFVNVRKVSFNKKEALLILSATIITGVTLGYFIVEFAFLGVAINFSSVVILTIIANIKTKILSLSLLYAILTQIIAILSATLTATIFSIIYILNPEVLALGREAVMDNFILALLYFVIMFAISYIISRKLGIAFHNRISLFDDILKRKLSIYLLSGAIITLMLFFINTFLHDFIADLAILTLAYAISLSICFTFLVFALFAFASSIQKDLELNYKIKQLQDLKLYTQNIETIATEMRTFKHDHKNLMLIFKSHIENQDWNGIQEHYDKYMGEFKASADTMDTYMDKLSHIKTPELKTILFVKFLQAQQLGIDATLEINEKITIPKGYNLLDICRISGIFIDNAIEACTGVDGATICLLVSMSDDIVHFVLRNTCHNPPPLNQIDKKGFTTKGGVRGLGLYTVSKLLSKNKHLFLQTKISNGYFTQKLQISPEAD